MKNFFFLVCTLLLAACPLKGRADTLTLETAGAFSGGEQIYPYTFAVNGTSNLVQLMCMDLNRTITFGETWAVNKIAVPMDNSAQSIGYRADAFIFSQLGNYSTSDVQYAVWSIFDPTDAHNNSAWDSGAASLASLGMSKATDSTLLASGFFNNFNLYVPTSDQSGWTAGPPQEFIGAAVTPEPASWVLLMTGVVCAGVLLLRRRQLLSAGSLA